MDLTPKTSDKTALPPSVEGSAMAAVRGPDDKVKYWLRQISNAHRREKLWRKDARECVDLYEADRVKDNTFNVFYSNTEILLPALYNVTPRPEVQRRFRDEDKLAKDSSEVVRRTLEYLADSNESDYPDFDTALTQAVLEALVPGRGITRFRHEVQFTQPQENDDGNVQLQQGKEGDGRQGDGFTGVAEERGRRSEGEDDDEQVEDDEEVGEGGEGAGDEEEGRTVRYETVCAEAWPWDRFTHGYAKTWRQVPWVAFDHYMTREELVANFGPIGYKIELTETETTSDEGGKEPERESAWREDTDAKKGASLALVHEIWDKNARRVYFVSPGYPSGFIRDLEDPLGLDGFFPMPEPLRLFSKIKTLTPTTLLKQYHEQARELNRVTVRINKILGAMKARGVYDSRFPELEKFFEAEDNVMIPASQISALQEVGNMDRILWLQPIEKLVAVLQQLYIARQEIKAVIYELTGISDVLRGSSSASETLGAQKIKEQWGSLRLSRSQKIVQKYARDCFRIMSEIAIRHLGTETIRKITGLPFPTGEEKAMAQMAVSQFQQQAAMMQALGQPPPSPPPEAAQVQAILAEPSWDEIMGLLRDELTRSYRIDIETNSTIDPEATDDKGQIVELMNAIGQFLNAMAPTVQSGLLSPEVIKGMLLTITRRFRFGPQLEKYIESIGQTPPPPDPAAQAAQAKSQADAAKIKMEMDFLQQKQALELQQMQAEFDLKRAELDLKRQELALKSQESRMRLEAQMQSTQIKAAADLASANAKATASQETGNANV